VNILFVGFAGDGNLLFDLQEALRENEIEIENEINANDNKEKTNTTNKPQPHRPYHHMSEWLRRTFTSIPHTLSPFGAAQTTTQRVSNPQTLTSAIRYRIRASVIHLSPKILSLIEDQIMWNARPEKQSIYRSESGETKGSESENEWYVNVGNVLTLLRSLTSYLGLSHTYNLFLLNPKVCMCDMSVKSHQSLFRVFILCDFYIYLYLYCLKFYISVVK
jgi:hypothetical protein